MNFSSLPHVLFMREQLASSRANDAREREREREAKEFFYNIAGVTYYHFSSILLANQINMNTM